MITKFTIKNFKSIEDLELDLQNRVALVGPNNSGKTTFLQAITIWDIGLRKWFLQKKGSKAKTRTAVTINRNEILSAPIPSAISLWKDLHVRSQSVGSNGKKGTQNIRFELAAEGVTKGQAWKIGLEFDYANTESMYCRLIPDSTSDPFPDVALGESIGFLPPMSGLAPFEDRLIRDVMFRKIGEGKTSEILRNLLWLVATENKDAWKQLCADIKQLFAIELKAPILSEPGGLLTMSYVEQKDRTLDLSAAGRGFQQMLLILGFLYSKKNSILLLDEPDAHLEVLRQKEVFKFLSQTAAKTHSQIIIATHSETVLDEVAQTGQVVAFIGKPHTVNKNAELKKALNLIGFTDYLQAERFNKIVYLEGTTDLDLLKAFAEVLEHPVKSFLDKIFVKYLSTNQPDETYAHFFGLKEAYQNLEGWALCDKIDNRTGGRPNLSEQMWQRREFENYLKLPDVLIRWAASGQWSGMEAFDPKQIMEKAIKDLIAPAYLTDLNDDWWKTEKASENIIGKVMARFFKEINLPVTFNKGDYYQLVQFMGEDEIDAEVKEKLDSLQVFLKDKS